MRDCIIFIAKTKVLISCAIQVQRMSYSAAHAHLCFRICKKQFSHDMAHIVSFVQSDFVFFNSFCVQNNTGSDENA